MRTRVAGADRGDGAGAPGLGRRALPPEEPESAEALDSLTGGRDVQVTGDARMMKPEELPFDVPEFLARDISDYIAAYGSDAGSFDMHLEILHQSANALCEHDRRWLLDYYTDGGWERGMAYDDYA